MMRCGPVKYRLVNPMPLLHSTALTMTQVDGFGTGSFDWTTDDSKNAFVDGKGLHIMPTLTTESTPITEAQLMDGYALNLTQAGGDGTCTGSSNSACSVRSNVTTGVIINPVRSARLNTKGKKSIKYGRVEVVAKLPKGDWLWPAIWMMPENSVYGPWPASGEIDIMEAKGNDHEYPHGRDYVDSTLHWGELGIAIPCQVAVLTVAFIQAHPQRPTHTSALPA